MKKKKLLREQQRRRNLRTTKALILTSVLLAFGLGVLARIVIVDDPKPDKFIVKEKDVSSGVIKFVEVTDEDKVPEVGDFITSKHTDTSGGGKFLMWEENRFVIIKVTKVK